MRIGISANTLQPDKEGKVRIDGIGTYTNGLIHALHREQQFPRSYIFSQHPFIKKSNQEFFPYLSTFLPKFINLHSKMENEIDIFHSTDYFIPRLKHVPVVATLHDAIKLKQSELVNQNLRCIKNYLLKKSAQWINHAITISHAMVEDVINYWGIKEENITVIYNGIEKIWFEEIDEEKKKATLNKYQLTKDYLLIVGTLQPRKNIERIIAAYKKLPNELISKYKLVIVGKNGWSTEGLLNDIAELENKQQGKWLQYISFEDVRALYQSATALLFPSLSEGFGLPILEGFASKIPVLTSNISSMPEIAGDGACLIDPYEVESIKEGIIKLLTDKELVSQLVEKGYKRAQEFSWERCALETFALYRKLI